MKIKATDDVYTIEENQLMRVEDAGSWILDCKEGCLLVTQPGFARDFVLRKGDCLRLGSNGRVLVGGASSARFQLSPPHTAAMFAGRIREHVDVVYC